ncbi:hypothetical protein Tco_1238847 [Tanacetum coccineum]
MSSPNHLTSGIEDAFSSNFLDFIPASLDYVLASPGKTYSSPSKLIWLIQYHSHHSFAIVNDESLHERESSRKTNLERHEEQIEKILNHLDELSLDGIEYIEDKIEGLEKAPAMTQDAIKKLVADSVTAALEAQAATMASTSNPNRNTGPTRTLVAKTGNYKEFISCQPFYFNGTEGAVSLICWFEEPKQYLSIRKCVEETKSNIGYWNP